MKETINITLSRRSHAIIDQTIVYQVNEDAYNALIKKGLTPEKALTEVRRGEPGDVNVVTVVTDVDEIISTHEEYVEEVVSEKSSQPSLPVN